MANEIQASFGSRTAMTITLASLASSTSGVGRQSDIVTGNIYQNIHLWVKLTTGTSPTINTRFYVYLIKSDGTERSDNAGTTDASLTVVNSRLLGVILNNSSSSNQTFYGEFTVRNPGPQWGVAIVHDTGVNLNATAGNHAVAYVGENPSVQ